MTPLASIATIDDLIVALLQVGLQETDITNGIESRDLQRIIEDFDPENYKKYFLSVWKSSSKR